MAHPYAKFSNTGAARAAQFTKSYATGGSVQKFAVGGKLLGEIAKGVGRKAKPKSKVNPESSAGKGQFSEPEKKGTALIKAPESSPTKTGSDSAGSTASKNDIVKAQTREVTTKPESPSSSASEPGYSNKAKAGMAAAGVGLGVAGHYATKDKDSAAAKPAPAKTVDESGSEPSEVWGSSQKAKQAEPEPASAPAKAAPAKSASAPAAPRPDARERAIRATYNPADNEERSWKQAYWDKGSPEKRGGKIKGRK